MVSTVRNTDVTQKDADHALVVAVTSQAVFDVVADGEGGEEVFKVGTAFPLLQALQRVNERLLEKNPAELLLFDVILITTGRQQQQQSSRIMSSTKHYGLEVSKFCFSSEEDYSDSLLTHNVRLFLSADRNEVSQASQKGVVSAVLEQQAASCPEQLRVLFRGDAIIQPNTCPTLLGEMRQRFGPLDSPLSMALLTEHGGSESCKSALLMLRSHGVNVDEAYCLAGVPQGPFLAIIRPHFLLSSGPSDLEES